MFSSNCPTVETAVKAIRTSLAREDVANRRSAQATRSCIGLVFYARCRGDGASNLLYDSDIKEELSKLHNDLPWLDSAEFASMCCTSPAPSHSKFMAIISSREGCIDRIVWIWPLDCACITGCCRKAHHLTLTYLRVVTEYKCCRCSRQILNFRHEVDDQHTPLELARDFVPTVGMACHYEIYIYWLLILVMRWAKYNADLACSLIILFNVAASPTLATSTTEHNSGCDLDEERTDSACSATLILLDSPSIKVTAFPLGLSPEVERDTHLWNEETLAEAVVDALDCNDHGSSSRGANESSGRFEALCLAFGVDRLANKAGCIVHLRRLNKILRDIRSVQHGGKELKCCPLVASVTADEENSFIVSTRDKTTGEPCAVTAGVAGAIISTHPKSASCFEIVHAGNHASLRGFQFVIKRMQGQGIAEVTPVRSLSAEEMKRHGCTDGVITAAEWCRHAVISSNRFEKLAMQAAVGIGVLRRMAQGQQSSCFAQGLGGK